MTKELAMEVSDQLSHNEKMERMKRRTGRVSFSASLPDDVSGAFADSVCVVKYSTDPFNEIRESILEMVRCVGVQDWKEMEELVYCYIVLNPYEVHEFIEHAFLSLCWSVEEID